MTDHLHHSTSSDSGSAQDSPPNQQPGLALDIQAIQILDSSDDCIKVLDLNGQILFMSRGGQVLLDIQDVAPFLNTSWIEFWQGADRQAASEAIAKATTGEVGTFQGYCPTPSGKPKWWDVKISPIRGTEGQVERLLCISRDITERRQTKDEHKQAEEKLRESEERYRAIVNQAVTGVACTDLNGNLTLVNQKYCDITGYSADELSQRRMQDITHPEDLPRNVELFHRMRTEGAPFAIEKRYIRKDGSIVWVNNSVSVIRDRDGKPQSAVAIVLDITERKQAEAALRESEAQFRLFTNASSDTVYKMSADWQEMRLLEGKNFLASTSQPNQTWLEQYIPAGEQSRVMAAIAEAIRTKSIFELEHQVIRVDGTIGWTFSRAIPLLDPQGEIIEWLGAASDITTRKRAELSANFLATVTQNLAGATSVEDIIQTVGEQLNRYLQVSICAFIEIDEPAEVAVIEHSWHLEDVPSLVGRYHLPEFVTGEFFQTARLGQAIIVRDVTTDSRIADAERFVALKVGSFINVPLIRNGEWKFTLGVYHQTPYNWRDDEIHLMGELANRIWTKLERTRVEIALRESEAKYRSLFTSIDEGFNLLEMIPDESGHAADFRIVETNPAWEQQTGLTDAVGKTLLEIAPNFEQQWLDFYSDVVTSGRGRRTEYYTASIDRWYTVYASRIGGAGSRQVAVVFNDITERKRAEDQLRDSAEQQQFLLNFSDTLRALPDKETIERTSLQLLAEYLGLDRVYIAAVYSSEDRAVIGPEYYRPDLMPMAGELPLSDFPEAFKIVEEQTLVIDNTADHPTLSDLDRQSFAAINLTAMVVASARRGERNVIWSVLAAMITPRSWTAGEVALLETVAERTWAAVERANAEAALRASEDKYRTLFESMDEAFAVVEVLADDNGKWNDFLFLEVNPAFVKQTGMEYPVRRKATELLGRPNPRWAEVYGQVAETGKPIRFEESEATLGRVFDLYVFRLGEDGSRLVAILFTNITDRKQAEAQRKQLLEREQAAREEAEQANRIKDEFLAVLSHELRSPLNPILGWTRLLQTGKLDESRQREALATIERNAKLQTQLIEDLLDISRIIQGKLSLTVAPVNLMFVITAAVETVRLAAEAKQIQILLDLTTAIAPVSGDAARLQQVVWNLLSNAVKFTPNGGQVTVELRQIHQLAQIRVIDRGNGISADFLPHVFEYFRQADATTTRKFGGLGLGLAIVKQIVEMHGGTVKAESPGENQGATFTVQLPVMQQIPSTVSEPSDAKAANQETPLSNLQILVVDDDDDTREFQTFLLEQNGARVTAVASGLEALQVLDQFIPDVLVSDVGMDQMDGYMLIQQIRSRPRNKGGMIPARGYAGPIGIALTAYAAEVDQQKALQVGFQTHITKPVDPEALLETIVSLLRSDR